MINLLPPEVKNNYRYARRNVGLRRWAINMLITLLGLGVIITYGELSLHQSIDTNNRQIASTQNQLNQQHQSQTEKQVQDITGSLRLAVQVLGREVLFSKLITQIGAVMPSGAYLTNLTINQTTGGLNLSAAATNYTAATQVQVNLQDPNNGIFQKADIVTITCNGGATDPTHPCNISLRALFDAKNQFLFINQGAKQ